MVTAQDPSPMDGISLPALTVWTPAASCPACLGISPGCIKGSRWCPWKQPLGASVPTFQVIHQPDTAPRRPPPGPRARPSGRPARGGLVRSQPLAPAYLQHG